MKSSRIEGFIVRALLIVFCVAFLAPLFWVGVTSLKTNDEIYDAANFHILPQNVSLEHFAHVFSQLEDFPVYCFNTAKITTATVFVVLLICTLCGYALAKLDFRGRDAFLSFILVIMALPWMVMLTPIYQLEVALGLLNTLPGLILPYAAMFLPIGILIMRSAFIAVPNELREAAQMDGADEFRIWWSVMLPIARPSMIVVLLMTFLSCWKEFTYAVTLNSLPSATTLAVGITYLKDEAQSWAFGTLSAAIVVVPLIAVFLFYKSASSADFPRVL